MWAWGNSVTELQYHAKSTSSNTAPMFRLYFRTILYMIGSKDNEKRWKMHCHHKKCRQIADAKYEIPIIWHFQKVPESSMIFPYSLACVIRYRENTTPNFTFFGCKIGYQSYKRLIFRNYFGTYGTWILICNKTFSKWLISNLKSRINWTKRTGNNSHELTIVPESISKDFST